MVTACQQGSSSSSSYEVFLSFHGKDVRTNFADHLYHALVGAGVQTFRDDEELSKGEEVAPNLHDAIQQSKISIPILSMNYGSSKWCLNELKVISECKRTRDQTVLPIFYKIEPRDIRNQTGEYSKAFDEENLKHFDKATIQKWREVLKEIGNLDGWHFKEGSHEAELVKEIVKTVSSTLNKRLLHVSDKLVGIESHIKEMVKLLDIECEAIKIVGIHGFGGIGKTTIARAVCNTILTEFEEYAFIENVREDAKKFGVQHLQNKLLTAILKSGSPNIIDVDTGIKVIEKRLCTKKVLVVLDDVDQDIQAEALIGDGELFGQGSKIIITSRDKDILTSRKATIYEPHVMNFDHSLELFSSYAFKRDRPQEEYLDLSKAMVKVTGGLPLALKVIGSSLFSKKRPIWESMLKKLQKIPNNDVVDSLKISYDGLGDIEQQMFLDISCFFIGWKNDIVCHIWEGCDSYPQAGLEVLCAKSLVTIDEDGKLRMHEVLRDLGRDIVRRESIKPGERSRLWSKEEALDVLMKQKGTNKCIGLTINLKQLSIDFKNGLKSGCLMSEGFDAMTELRFLQLDHAQILGNCNNSFSELSWLSWKGCPERFALSNFCPEKLTVLDLSFSWITENWMGWNYIKMAANLKVLELKFCLQLRSTPNFSENRLLEVLNLESCRNLVRVDISIGHLTNLVTLDMKCCECLVDLPTEICELASLETLLLDGCQSLEKLPDNFDNLTSLTSCTFNHCQSLQSITNLPSSWTSFSVKDNHFIRYISGLPSILISLSIQNCKSVRYISDLPSSLRSLEISRCDSLVELISSASGERGLKSLEQCSIRNCKSFKNFKRLRGSKNLLSLEICENDIWSEFEGEEMNSLEELKIMECNSLEKIPYLRDSKRLRELHIWGCLKLTEIERLEGYESLQRFSITAATLLETLSEDVSTLNNLRDLYVWTCKSMKRLPNLSNLKELKELNIGKCDKLTKIEGLYGLEALEILTIRDCENLAKLRLVYKLKALQSLERLPGLSNLKKLRQLNIERCERLTQIIGLNELESLLGLRISYCNNLAEIHGVHRLKSLKTLDIARCCSLERLPDLSNFKELWGLKIVDCDKLSEILGLNALESLQKLEIIGCNNLTNIHGVERLESLSYVGRLPGVEVKIKGCRNLPDLELHH